MSDISKKKLRSAYKQPQTDKIMQLMKKLYKDGKEKKDCFEEIAATLGISEDAVKRCFYRNVK